MNPLNPRTILILTVVLLCQCGVPQPPKCARVPKASRVPTATLVATAREQWAVLGNPSRSAEWGVAREKYNAAVAKLIDQLRCGPGDWDSRAEALGTQIAPPGEHQTNIAALDAVFPASMVDVSLLNHHQTTSGVGVPMVGWKKTTPIGTKRPPFQLPNGFPYNLTATLDFDTPGPPTWHFAKRWLHNDVKIRGTRQTLASDWSAPNAFLWKMCDLDNLKIQNVLMPARYMQETGIYFLQPYDPKKIPLVFVHGLVSSPDAFKNLINDLAPHPWFRERYQVWLYNYPTGNPWIFSSMKFREEMRGAIAYARSKGDDRNLRRMVVACHSMGGLVARSSVTDPGTKFYDTAFKVPIDQLKVSEPTRKLIRDASLYQPLTEPRRVVFMAVPHKGSPVATIGPAVWISRLISLPKKLTVELLDATIQTVNEVVTGAEEKPEIPNSINSLSPKNKYNIALATMPLPRNITFHSIVGDRGKGGLPNCSDGIVPYWSSHVEPVASELVVPCNHSVPDNDATAAELERILRLHLESN